MYFLAVPTVISAGDDFHSRGENLIGNFGVMPKPEAEFSPFAITKSTAFCETSAARFLVTNSRPGEPTMSPMNSMRMNLKLSS